MIANTVLEGIFFKPFFAPLRMLTIFWVVQQHIAFLNKNKDWQCWSLLEPCASPKWRWLRISHPSFIWQQLTASDHHALSYSQVRSISVLPHDSCKTCVWFPFVPISVKPEAHILFFEMFLTDECFPSCNSLIKSSQSSSAFCLPQ